MKHANCADCERTLISLTSWRRLTREERAKIADTHAWHEARGLCQSCYRRQRSLREGRQPRRERDHHAEYAMRRGGWKESEIDYAARGGTFVRVGLIMRPTVTRCPE